MLSNKDSRHFCLFASCTVVNGAGRATLCDVQRGQFVFLSQDQVKLLYWVQKYAFGEAKNLFDLSQHPIIDDFISSLQENAFGFFTKEKKQFPKINFSWESPFKITNSIIDLASPPNKIYANVINALCKQGCRALQIRCFYLASTSDINLLLQETLNTGLNAIEIILPYHKILTSHEQIKNLIDQHLRIVSVILYAAPENKTVIYREFNITLMELDLSSNVHCGVVNNSNFTLNIQSFSEYKHHNSCLNRKISIDVDGNIKNCPSMSQSFGNIKDTTLQEALDHPDFKKYWNVTKDQISVCKDCEFRYICTDCRGYIENPEDMYSKPLKCGYNPYTCEWEEWSTNPLKQKAIDYYGMRDVLPEFKLKPDYAPATSPSTT